MLLGSILAYTETRGINGLGVLALVRKGPFFLDSVEVIGRNPNDSREIRDDHYRLVGPASGGARAAKGSSLAIKLRGAHLSPLLRARAFPRHLAWPGL